MEKMVMKMQKKRKKIILLVLVQYYYDEHQVKDRHQNDVDHHHHFHLMDWKLYLDDDLLMLLQLPLSKLFLFINYYSVIKLLF